MDDQPVAVSEKQNHIPRQMSEDRDLSERDIQAEDVESLITVEGVSVSGWSC